ncbi:TRAP transporter permease [Bacillus sp. ISL-47]|uniref:TRAP transporter permease n=1 Tax=Bacillus sp. ISL-47 TaxID=2819130 RepID=UPI001BE55E52|nr:TRAP transporter permease [Bacillus sp. ISL-47]MBT2686718.1 TRAP transporter permease [Bacillus sp. ISL-47]MBT2706934.1 TRAP transporter permease [Pseudomonas sp. ISL-84]
MKKEPKNERENENSKDKGTDVKEVPTELDEKINADEIAKKYDVETRYRNIKGKAGLLVASIAVAMSAFHLFTAGVPMVSTKHRALHLAFALVLIFLLYPGRKKSSQEKPTIFDYLFAIIAAISTGYLVVMFDTIAIRGMSTTTMDLIMGFITMVVVLEATRRSIGIELPILALLFLGYAYLGPYLPGDMTHRGYDLTTLIEHMYIGSEGIFGIALGTSAAYIFLFILFGAFLNGTGLSGFFTNAAMAGAGHKVGGPAKVSIITSGALGMINGSAVANVASTGVFTIPLMRKVGYSRRFAGGIEATASTGGQFTPPIMGTAAFIMAEFLGVPYKDIIIAAIIPALLYYVSLWVMVHYEALKTGLSGIPKDQLPDIKKVFLERAHLLLPIALLLYMLLAGYTPIYSAFFSIIATYAVSFLRKSTRMDFKTLLRTLEQGAKGAITVSIATAVVGFIIGVVSLTGIGLKLANLILVFSGGQLLLTLLLTMITCIILGMGLPTAACYIVGATVAAPALTQLGVEPIVAHFFVLYFACLSAITPPVALASYAAAGLSGESPSKVGWTGFRLGITGFIVPFIFVYSPVLLLQTNDYLAAGLALATALIGVFALGTAVVGYLLDRTNAIERLMLLASSLTLIKAGPVTDVIGISLLLIVVFMQWRRTRVLKPAIKGKRFKDEAI